MRVGAIFRAYKISLQFFDKDDKKTLIVTTDTLSKFSLTKFLMENFDSDNGSLHVNNMVILQNIQVCS